MVQKFDKIYTLDALLSLFVSGTEVSRICGLSRSAANHWYKTDSKIRRSLPNLANVVQLADYVCLTDEELGAVIRDIGVERKKMLEHRNRSNAAKQREAKKRREGLREQQEKIRQIRRRNDLESYNREKQLESMRLKELEEEARKKQEHLDNRERRRRLELLERRLHGGN